MGRTNFSRSKTARRIAYALSLTATGLLVPMAEPAVATSHVVEAVAPQWAPTAGATPIRIYGDGFTGVTAVKIGGVNATAFSFIDDDLITAVVPAGGPNNTFDDVTVTVGGTDAVLDDGFYYSNATLSVTPSTNLDAGDAITVTLTGYSPSTPFIIPELNPLQIYYEHPNFTPDIEPPYVDTLPPIPVFTNASGNKTQATNLTDPFNPDGQAIDPNAVCPTNQTTMNFLGVSAPASFTRPVYSGRCLIVTNQFGIASLDTPINFGTDDELTPAAPVFTTNTGSANQGATITITSGSNWNANPFFGSSKVITNKPGQTKTTVQICGIGGNPNSCSTTKGNGTVTPTRYINETLSGATLAGTIVVGADIPDGCACTVRVRQNRPAGGFIQATVPLSVT